VTRRLRLRGRLTVLCAGIVGLVLILGSVAAYVSVKNALVDQIDGQLQSQAKFFARVPRNPEDFDHGQNPGGGPGRFTVQPPPGRPDNVDLGQLISPAGTISRTLRGGTRFRIPLTDSDRAVAEGHKAIFLSDRTVGGTKLRVVTAPLPGGGALQVARSLSVVDGALSDLRLVLALLVVVGTGAAALLARLFSKPALEPVTELTEAAEHIEATGDLGRRIEARSGDEVGRMATSFNGMLDRVEDSVDAQRQLVADASHELRTPVSALRTNVEVLAEAGDEIDAEQRGVILTDVVAQADELSHLVGDLMELARGEERREEEEDVRLDALVAEAVDRARRHAPTVSFLTTLVPCVVPGAPDRLSRAVNNLLDNAAKYGPPGGEVDVTVTLEGDRAQIAVRDHGPGVDPAEADHIFDRFARGAQARQQGGAGLGLAIVRQVAESHGGTIAVTAADGGGARFVLTLPQAVVPDN
jgi:two-component system sensor histidine kinase MprB